LLLPWQAFVNFARKFLLFVCAGVLWAAVAISAEPRLPGTKASEQLYWKRLHEQLDREKAETERQQSEYREQVISALPELARAAAAIQPELIAAEDGMQAPLPPTFSWFDRYPHEIGFGLVTVLIGVFARRVLLRHKREAEIRALTGGYLSDGTGQRPGNRSSSNRYDNCSEVC